MKKTLLILLSLIFILTASTYLFLNNISQAKALAQKENNEFEYYLGKKISGTDLATIIGKAIDKNEKNNIPKDEKNYYIENDKNTLKIEIKLKSTKKTYTMEEIYKNNITEFVKYFNFSEFECTDIKYHQKTGKISNMLFEEI